MNTKTYSWILIASGIIGVLMSLLLTHDKIALLQNPGTELPCNINPLVSCGPIINTWQASVFGVPNPLLGTVGFSALLTIGILSLAGIATINNKLLNMLLVGLSTATLFINWLIFQSIFVIGALCLYCMITWAFTWPAFWFTLSKRFNIKHSLTYFISWYLFIILIILLQFRDFFFG